MKHVMMIVVAAALLMATGCQEKHDVGAAELLEEIKQLFKQGQYAATLDSIESLRMHFPKAIHERQEALRIWQEASLKMAQQDIALTDSALQAVTAQMQAEPRIYERNMLGAYDLVQTFTCSTGLHDSTPHGVFLDGHPLNRWHYFKKFYCWAQYSFEIEGDILFHSVIYSSNNENSLRSGSLYALGNPASHGCVRLQVADAKWLFENCKRGETVIVIG